MDPIDEISRAQRAQLVDEDGNPATFTLEPGLDHAQITRLENEIRLPLPRALRALLAHTAGLDGVLEQIDFTGRSLDVAVEEMFPSGLPIAHDGYGNFWVVDVTPGDDAQAPVFFACHDPPVILLQSPGIGHFLHEAFRMHLPPHESLVDDVHEDRLFNVWGTNPGAIAHAAALDSGDEALTQFAATIEHDFEIVDLRAAPVGMGFSWGRHGPRTEVRRHRYELLSHTDARRAAGAACSRADLRTPADSQTAPTQYTRANGNKRIGGSSDQR